MAVALDGAGPRDMPGGAGPKLQAENVSITFTSRSGTVTAVEGIDLSIRDGEFVVIVGPSGCGKTTALRMVAGLEEITSNRKSVV